MSIEAVHLARREAIDARGRIFPIVKMFDCDGIETDENSDAVVVVAGAGSSWYSIDMRQFERMTAQ